MREIQWYVSIQLSKNPLQTYYFVTASSIRIRKSGRKKIKEKENADENEKTKAILEDAKKVLNRNDLESEKERKVLELRILPN